MNTINQQTSGTLNRQSSTLAAEMVTREFARLPALEKRYGAIGREKCQQDASYHLAYLSQAIAAGNTELFANYIGWAKVMLAKRGVPAKDLTLLLEIMKEVLAQELALEFSALTDLYLDHAIQRLPGLPVNLPSCIGPEEPLAALAALYLQALLRGERHIASKLILDAVQGSTPVRDLYLYVFQPSQYEIGRLWQVNEISVAQEHYCTAATQMIMSQLYPYIFGSQKTRGNMVATCVSGDLHEIGARMVCDFFELEGWNTHYLGANVPASSVVQTVLEQKAGLLAISATIAYHIPAVTALIAAVRNAFGCERVKIVVGGYPFNVAPELWRTVSADGSAPNAQEAVLLAERLTSDHFAA